MAGRVKAWCRTCLFQAEKLDMGRYVCAHPIMAAVHGRYSISEKQDCLLWVKRYKEKK